MNHWKNCPHCFSCKITNIIYIEKYDALACLNCNLWLEETCEEKNCEYCQDRPKHPTVKVEAEPRSPQHT